MKRSFVSLLSGFAFIHRYIFRFQVDSHMNGVAWLLLGHKKYRLDVARPEKGNLFQTYASRVSENAMMDS